jgi:bifunctional non-homologous end joining protein LigD
MTKVTKPKRPARGSANDMPAGARPAPLPAFVKPSLALLVDKPPTGPQWVHEIKFDGYRMQARIDGGDIRLLTRKALDWSKRFPTIAAALGKLDVNTALLDGEIVSEDERGVPHFSDLQDDLKSGRRDRLRYHVFDLLYLDGLDLTGATLLDRKSVMERLLKRPPAGSPLRYSEHSDENGATMLKQACKMGLEGIISKRNDLPYRSGRDEHWLKIKCVLAQEFVILGYVLSTAGTDMVGSLVLGYYEDGKLVHAGRVGTGWSHKLSRSLREAIEELHAPKPTAGRFRRAPTKACGGRSRSWCVRSSSAAGRPTGSSGKGRSRGCGKTSRPRRLCGRQRVDAQTRRPKHRATR